MTASTDLDLAHYRTTNPDLAGMTDADLKVHYQTFGVREGRTASPRALREVFVNAVPSEETALEIGPFCAPALAGPHTKYFDIMSTAELRGRAATLGLDPAKVPNVEYVSPSGDLGLIETKFANILSSHCVEHQPDLIRHLNQVEDLLNDGGRYWLLVPDKRYCFDHSISLTTFNDVMTAYRDGRRTHTLQAVIEHRVLTTHNDAQRHWMGDHQDTPDAEDLRRRLIAALNEHSKANGGYIDVHAWQFTPSSFGEIIRRLLALSLIHLHIEELYETPRNRLEFTAVLRKATSSPRRTPSVDEGTQTFFDKP